MLNVEDVREASVVAVGGEKRMPVVREGKFGASRREEKVLHPFHLLNIPTHGIHHYTHC